MSIPVKPSVRFQEMPVLLDDESSLEDSSNSDLLKALNIDESSSNSEDGEQDRTVFEDSQYNRMNYVGQTPHSKVVDAKRDRKALRELMNVPAYANSHFNVTKDQSKVFKFNQTMELNGKLSQSKMFMYNSVNKTALNESSYHFDLVNAEGEENFPYLAPEISEIQLLKPPSATVRFNEKDLIQNRIQTPAVNRKQPIRKTPMPQKSMSNSKSMVNFRSPSEIESPENASINFSSEKASKIMNAKELSSDQEEEKNNSLEISQISLIEKDRTVAQFQSSTSSRSSNTTCSPLASLVARPDISKASPVLSVPSPECKRSVAVGTSYSLSLDLPVERKHVLGVDVATSYSPPPPSFAAEKQQLLVTENSSYDYGKIECVPVEKDCHLPRREIQTSDTMSLIGGVGFGKGPVVSHYPNNQQIAVVKVSVAPETTNKAVTAVALLENGTQSICNESKSIINHYKQNMAVIPMNRSENKRKDILSNLKPAMNWYSPRNTRKPQPKEFSFDHTHPLLVQCGPKLIEETIPSQPAEPYICNSLFSRPSLIHPSTVPKGYFSGLQQQNGTTLYKSCDDGIPVDFNTIVTLQQSQHLQFQSTSSRNGMETVQENQNNSSIDGYSYTLEELMTTIDKNQQQLNNTTCTSAATSVNANSKGYNNQRFDLTTVNIGGTPSTIHTSPEEILSTSYAQNHHCNAQYSTGKTHHTQFSSFSSVSPGPFQAANNSSLTSAMMGPATRIPKVIAESMWDEEKDEEESVPEVLQEEQSYQRFTSSKNTFYPKSSLMNDVTFLTDIAVAQFTRELDGKGKFQGTDFPLIALNHLQQSKLEEEDDLATIPTNTSLNTTNQAGYETTFTLDHSFFKQQHGQDQLVPEIGANSSTNIYSYPRLAIKSLKRDANNPYDIKEIGFESSPNELMTVMLTFKNDRLPSKKGQDQSLPLVLTSKTMFLRVEPLYSQRNQNQTILQKHLNLPELSSQEKEEVFSVSPEKLDIAVNEEGMLFVTFAPKSEGIYSGVLQVKYQRKSLILLLRGECAEQFSLQNASNLKPVSSVKKPLITNPMTNSPSDTILTAPQTIKKKGNNAQVNANINIVHTPNEQIDFVSSPESTNTYADVSPNTFQDKLRVLQRKIFEISHKSKKSLI
jgi:hypothetical protein